MTEVQSFHDRAMAIATDFLHTVLVVDDEALPEDRPRVEPDQPLAAPPGRAITADLAEPAEDPKVLPSRQLLEAFADRGLICGLLAPTGPKGLPLRVVQAAKRADLIVLDWVIGTDIGKIARRLVTAVLKEDSQEDHRRMRAIAIYTGQDDLVSIAEALVDDLKETFKESPVVYDNDDRLSFTKGPLHIAVYAKEHAQPVGDAVRYRVRVHELPERLTADFARMTEGLVSGVALKSLAALRHDTHRILKVLSSDLDVGYLGHRAALPDAPDAERHLIEMVTSEIRSVLDDQEVGNAASTDAIEAWLVDPAHAAKWGEQIEGKRLTVAEVREILGRGLGSEAGLDAVAAVGSNSRTHLKKVTPKAHRAFGDDGDETDRSAAEFALRMTLRTHYSRPTRILQLGTIVSHEGSYRLCVQPLCDCIRLSGTEPSAFPFLRLDVVPGQDGAVDYVIRDRDTGEHVRLASAGKPSSVLMYQFQAGKRGSILAGSNGPDHQFVDVDGGVHFWVADLKPDVASTAIVNLGQQFGRLGVDEPEVLRLSRR